jgi:hypothetical protein
LINNELVFSLKSRILGQTHKTTNQVRDARTTQDIMLGIQECHFFGRRKCWLNMQQSAIGGIP